MSSLPGSLCLDAQLVGSFPYVNPARDHPWKIRADKIVFDSFWKSSTSAVIFFHGASIGNPGVSGAGGLVFSSNILFSYRCS